MNNIKFLVKVNHRGTRAPAYVQSIARVPFQMTTNLKLALMMGKFARRRCEGRPEFSAHSGVGTSTGAWLVTSGAAPPAELINQHFQFQGGDWSILTSTQVHCR